MNHHLVRLISIVALAIAWIGSEPAAKAQAERLGPESCSTCHPEAFEIWSRSSHARTAEAMADRSATRAILDRLEERAPTEVTSCGNCHSSPRPNADEISDFDGVTCESCHGAAGDWWKHHTAGFGKNLNEDHDRTSRAAGFVGPRDVYDLVSRCYSCHLGPEPALVDLGGQSLGSPFEVVAWCQGRIRHNVQQDPTNPMAPPPRLRIL